MNSTGSARNLRAGSQGETAITMDMQGAIIVSNPISAVKPKRPGGQHYVRLRKSGGHNVRWRRFTDSLAVAIDEAKKLPVDKLDQAIATMAACAKMATPISRLVYFGHLTTRQGMAGRRYADIMGTFERYHVDKASRSARAQNVAAERGGEDQEIQRHINRGTIKEYEREAKRSRKEYDRAQKVLSRYADSVTGRNLAKNVLDDLCLSDIEPPTQYRQNVSAVLEALAKEFALGEKKNGSAATRRGE